MSVEKLLEKISSGQLSPEEGRVLIEAIAQMGKMLDLAERTAEAIRAGAYATNRDDPGYLTKEQVVINPPAFEQIDQSARSFYMEHVAEGDVSWVVDRMTFEFISLPDGRLRVGYPMLGGDGDLDLEAEVAPIHWVGDMVAGYVNAEDWFPVTVMGDMAVLTVAPGGIDE